MRLEFAVEAVVGHVEDVAEQVLAAGSRAAGAGGLHREAAHREAFEDIRDGLRVEGGDALRVAQVLVEVRIEDIPGGGNDGLRAHQVGDHPLGAGRNLGGEVGIAGGDHPPRCGDQHVHIGDDPGRGRALEGLLRVLVGDGGAEGREAVHGGGGGDAQVALAVMVGGQLADVVDDARTDGNGDGIRVRGFPEALFGRGLGIGRIILDALRGGHVPVQDLVRHFDVAPLGMELFLVDDVFLRRDAGAGHQGMDGLAAGRPGVDIGDDDGLPAREQLLEYFGHLREDALAHFEDFRVGGHFQGRRDAFFGIHIKCH